MNERIRLLKTSFKINLPLLGLRRRVLPAIVAVFMAYFLNAGGIAPAFANDLDTKELDPNAFNQGKQLARLHCTRCHVVGDMNKYGGIGSTPSFGAIKTMPDWKERFDIFFALPPHPAVVRVEGISEKRPENLPAFTKQITLTIDELENLLGFIYTLPKANFN
jgi:mono/diheme cytochrome c family protein